MTHVNDYVIDKLAARENMTKTACTEIDADLFPWMHCDNLWILSEDPEDPWSIALLNKRSHVCVGSVLSLRNESLHDQQSTTSLCRVLQFSRGPAAPNERYVLLESGDKSAHFWYNIDKNAGDWHVLVPADLSLASVFE